MDKNTIDSLKAAYSVAPSTELAKVLVFHYVAIKALDEANLFLSNTGDDLDVSELSQLLTHFHEESHTAYCNTLMLLLKSQNTEKIDAALLALKTSNTDTDISSIEKQLQRHGFINVKPSQESNRTEHSPTNDKKLKIVEKSNIIELTDLTRYEQETTDFNDVVGLTHIKKQIHKKIILPFQKPSLFQKFKKKIGGGVLLYGPPGCGKTLLARATAGECHANFFNIEITDVLDMYIGESEQKLHAIFEKARAQTPSVLFFDELEALAGKREHTRNQSSSNTVSQLLTELDGFSKNNSGVLVLASTNVPWAIDSAFLRPGRFDRMFFVPPPDKDARAAIVEHHLKNRPHDASIELQQIATRTSGYSGADLANLVETAADEAIEETIAKGQDVEISTPHFKEALEQTRATTTEWLTTARNYARYANDGGRYDDVLDFLKRHGK